MGLLQTHFCGSFNLPLDIFTCLICCHVNCRFTHCWIIALVGYLFWNKYINMIYLGSLHMCLHSINISIFLSDIECCISHLVKWYNVNHRPSSTVYEADASALLLSTLSLTLLLSSAFTTCCLWDSHQNWAAQNYIWHKQTNCWVLQSTLWYILCIGIHMQVEKLIMGWNKILWNGLLTAPATI